MCIQEHFLLDAKDKKYSNTRKLRNRYSNHGMYLVPAYKDTSQITKGRGKGGLATIWDRKLTKYVSKITCENYRIQATKFNFPNGQFLVINTYFPCDPRNNNFNDAELLGLLTDIQSIILQSNVRNIFLAGDLNSDFSRNSRFTKLVQNYFEDIGLNLLWEISEQLVNVSRPSFTYTSTTNGVTSYSTIDHLACSQGLLPFIAEAGVLHSGENTSNHSAIYAKVRIGDVDLSVEKISATKHIDWSSATEGAQLAYRTRLSELLDSVRIPDCSLCTNIQCSAHDQDIEYYTLDILENIQAAARETLPSKGGGGHFTHKKSTPGWSEFVQPYLEESKFWHSLWVSAQKPRVGALCDAMKLSKQQYKYAVRRLKRAGDSIKNDKFVESIIGGGVNIFKEIRKLRGGGMSCSSRIDDEVGSLNIANHFATIYGKLYNRVEHSDSFDELCDNINQDVDQQGVRQVERITEEVVRQALKMLKGSKRDVLLDIHSDCLINGPPALVTHLTRLLRTFVLHGRVPNFILMCTLLPLVKDNLADSTSSDNYRAIASSSLLLKLLDIVILLLEGDKLQCDELQFGFQARSGTVMCTWTAISVIDYFNRKGSPVYGCAMDLSKAFDMVDWKELFLILQKRNVSPIFLRVLIYIYRNQQFNVKWSSSFSNMFSVKNGVRQGAISSPILFSVYINDLLIILRKAGFGCHIGSLFVGCLGYADDLLLLSGSRSGLQSMVDICQQFTCKKNLKFSTNPNAAKSKTKCIVFSKKQRDLRDLAPVLLNGDPLPWVHQVKHLGNILQCDNSMTTDCTVKRGVFIGKVNSLFQEFSFVDPKVKMKLINIFASSFYGSGLWDLFSSACERLYKSWNVAVRLGFGVPPTTHRNLAISATPPMLTQCCAVDWWG